MIYKNTRSCKATNIKAFGLKSINMGKNDTFRVGIINHQIRKCANKYIRDRLQYLRSSKKCTYFPLRAQSFFSQLRKSARSEYKMSYTRKRSYTDIEAISNIWNLKKNDDISILVYLSLFLFSSREQSY